MPSAKKKTLQKKLRISHNITLLLLAAVIGMISSIGAWSIRLIPHWVYNHFHIFVHFLGLSFIWSSLLLSVTTFWLTYLISRKWMQPQGIAEVMITGYIDPRYISTKAIMINTLGSLLSLSGGLPVGSVGPTVYFGAGLAGRLAALLHKNPLKMRTLLACGAAASISALFNAPIGGMLFAVEIILHKYNTEYFSMVIVSAFTASLMSRWMFGSHPVFEVSGYSYHSIQEIPLFILLGILCGLYACIHIQALYGFASLWMRFHISQPFQQLISSVVAWISSFFFPFLLFGGFVGIEKALFDKLPPFSMVCLLIIFLLAHSMVMSAGFYGGIFGPVLFVGSMLGGAYGIFMQHLFPTTVTQPGLYALLGIGGAVASTCRAPLTAILLLFEMTSDYNLILPLMITSVMAFTIHHGLEDRSIFTAKLYQNYQYRRSIPLR